MTGEANHPPANDPAAPHSAARVPVTVVILTKNEQDNIADCIRSCDWCDDLHVLDSGSTDRTCAIAWAMGAQVHTHAFTSFGEQRNWAIDHITTRHDWHFHLDADERFTPPLVREMVQRLNGQLQAAAFLVPSKLIFHGRWLKHSGQYPAYQVRLFHRERCRFRDFGHGQREDTQGPIAVLREPYLHYSFSKGLFDWFSKHNQYSHREAVEARRVMQAGEAIDWRGLWSGSRVRRRRAFKHLSFRMPVRPLWRFCYQYILRMGFLDGVAGFHYCAMIAVYEYWIGLKMRELTQTWPQATDALAQRLLAEERA